jgi:subtilisin family serine protease
VIQNLDPTAVPLVSVGALNPNKKTIALFSNLGSWVACHRPGAAVVSTMPPFNGSLQPGIDIVVPGDGERSLIDMDDYTGGFGTWSGTSFAAPVLVGEIAAALCGTDLTVVDQATAVQRATAAVRSCTERTYP